MTPDELKSHIEHMFIGELETLTKKNHDYSGDDTDALRNFRLVEWIEVCSLENGILVRMCDKIARLANLLKSPPAVADESIHDTIHDLRNYAAILDAGIVERKMAAEDMKLPEGRTCRDCANFERWCSWFLGERCTEDCTTCDWFPRRFREKT